MGAVKDHHDQFMAGRQRELERVQLKLTASEERVRVLSEALREIARQKLIQECDEDELGDYEYGYDALIGVARQALGDSQ